MFLSRRCSGSRSLPRLLLVLGVSALVARAAASCSSSPLGEDSVQGLVRLASVVIEGKVLAHSVAELTAGRRGGEETTPLGSPLLRLSVQPDAAAAAGTGTTIILISSSSSSSSGTILPSSPAPSPQLPHLGSPSLAPASAVARVRVHQVWPAKSGGLRKDALLWLLLGERGSACGSALKEEGRYVFFMEPVAAASVGNSSESPPPLFRASSPPLETGRNLKKEVSRALCTRGCGLYKTFAFTLLRLPIPKNKEEMNIAE
ncbi:hypothetical protein E2320_017173 [Naja naja]|nr:hypothetical protein E2320_017173 [Naja naja]